MNTGPTACFDYGVYLGSTFGHCPNVLWMSGNDCNELSGGDGGFSGGVSGWSVSYTDAMTKFSGFSHWRKIGMILHEYTPILRLLDLRFRIRAVNPFQHLEIIAQVTETGSYY